MPLAGRLDGIESRVEGVLQGIRHLLHRLPRQTAFDAVPLPVGVSRDQDGQRVNASALEPLSIGERVANQLRRRRQAA